jgi:hypothetical protein
MDIISIDIMNSGANPDYSVTKLELQGITNTSGAASLELVMDLNDNGTTNGASDIGEDVIYSLQGTSLTRTCVNPVVGNITQPVANNVTQLAFTYLDSQYTPIVPAGTLTNTQAQSVKFIQVAITKNSDQVDPQTHKPVTRHLQRTVCRRNG